jgi:hypothetical protein
MMAAIRGRGLSSIVMVDKDFGEISQAVCRGFEKVIEIYQLVLKTVTARI